MPRLMPGNLAAMNVWSLAAPHLQRDSAWLEVQGGKRELSPTSPWRMDMSAVRLAVDAAGIVDVEETMEKLNVILGVYREMVQ